jgi:hypothetical protein
VSHSANKTAVRVWIRTLDAINVIRDQYGLAPTPRLVDSLIECWEALDIETATRAIAASPRPKGEQGRPIMVWDQSHDRLKALADARGLKNTRLMAALVTAWGMASDDARNKAIAASAPGAANT